METLILTADDLRTIVNRVGVNAVMDDSISSIHDGILNLDRHNTVVPARDGFKYSHPDIGLIEWMPGMRIGDSVQIKIVGYHPNSGRRFGLPTIVSTMSMYSVESGHLLCLMDASFLTALRTGAASAVATRILSRETSSTLGIIGVGAQAVTQLHALSRVRDVDRVHLFDTNRNAVDSFHQRVACLNLSGLAIDKADSTDFVSGVDILVTASSVGIGEGPIFEDVPYMEALHINAVGSDFAGKTELPAALTRRAHVCPDFRDQALLEGECQQIMPEDVGPDLETLVKHEDRYADLREQCTVFDSTGWALEDMMTMELFMRYADDLNIGSMIEVECVPKDPLNPYEFVDEGIEFDEPATSLMWPAKSGG